MAVKLALVVRADLGMGRGKIAAQVAHAAVAAVLSRAGTRDLAVWLEEGQPRLGLPPGDRVALADEDNRLKCPLRTRR